MALALQVYRNLSRKLPLTVAFGTCFVKGGASDIFAQSIVEKRLFPWNRADGASSLFSSENGEDGVRYIDFRRVLAFSMFSGLYCGCAQHFVYNVAFTKVFGTAQTVKAAIKKTIADVFIHTPFLYLPVYYAFEYKALKGSASQGLKVLFYGPGDSFNPDMFRVMKGYCLIWPGVHMLNFTLTPPELRISVIACVSFVWLVILSNLSHEATEEPHVKPEHVPNTVQL